VLEQVELARWKQVIRFRAISVAAIVVFGMAVAKIFVTFSTPAAERHVRFAIDLAMPGFANASARQ
jgi:hypothetical protein